MDVALVVKDHVQAMVSQEPNMVQTVELAPPEPRPIAKNGKYVPMCFWIPYNRKGPQVDTNHACIRYFTQYHCGHLETSEVVHCPACVTASLDNPSQAKCTIIYDVETDFLHQCFCDTCDALFPPDDEEYVDANGHWDGGVSDSDDNEDVEMDTEEEEILAQADDEDFDTEYEEEEVIARADDEDFDMDFVGFSDDMA